jgi:ribosome-associated protein
VDDPIRVTASVAIPLSEVELRASRPSGPGGQHANVTASRIEAVFDVAGSQALTEEQRRRVMSRVGPRLVAVAQDTRSQARNRELALERLAARLARALPVRPTRKRTKPTRESRRRWMEAKRRRAELKRERRRPRVGDD